MYTSFQALSNTSFQAHPPTRKNADGAPVPVVAGLGDLEASGRTVAHPRPVSSDGVLPHARAARHP